MQKYYRLAIALSILLVGAALVPYVTFPAERFAWQAFVGVYEPPAEVSIENFAYEPATIIIPTNTTVRWTNNDSEAHTVTSETSGLFDSGNLQPGESFEHLFDTPGVYAYFCTLHPSMTGTVIVSDNVFRVFLPLVAR